ncbi:PTS glucose transporter subunit IIA [Streptomyces sp. NPDC005438]|uniref:PTS sugar transporter subunit IIA n=1 Tax=Streptomyces sp. NPDC005438 TaxID=3156880 RepID=UPI0033A1AA14
MTTVTSPVAGEVVGLAVVPDPVFSDAMVGPGTAIDPRRQAGEVSAPVDGLVVTLHPHAFVVVDDDGHAVLTHLGIDTVQLNGQGFEPVVSKGDRVHRGDLVLRWDPTVVEAAGKSPLCPVIALDASPDAVTEVRESGPTASGDALFLWR